MVTSPSNKFSSGTKNPKQTKTNKQAVYSPETINLIKKIEIKFIETKGACTAYSSFLQMNFTKGEIGSENALTFKKRWYSHF